MKTCLALLLATISALPAAAEVKSVNDSGFAVEHVIQIAAPRQRVYAALIEPGKWWNASHSWSGDAANMTIDARPGGCFCERLPKSGGFAEHARVVFAQPGHILRLSGALGPLQAEAVTGTLSFTLDPGPTDDTTRLTVSYVVGGYVRNGTAQFAPVVDMVIGEQAKRLAAFAGPHAK